MRVHPIEAKSVVKDIGSLVYVGERVDSWILTPGKLFKVDSDGAILPRHYSTRTWLPIDGPRSRDGMRSVIPNHMR